MASSKRMKKQPDRIQFSYYAKRQGPWGDVFRYLLRNSAHTTHKGKQKGLAAMSAFWKPFSAQSVLELNDIQVRAIALDSIAELEKQIQLIRQTFHIPDEKKPVTREDVERIVTQLIASPYANQQAFHNAPAPLSTNYHPINR